MNYEQASKLAPGTAVVVRGPKHEVLSDGGSQYFGKQIGWLPDRPATFVSYRGDGKGLHQATVRYDDGTESLVSAAYVHVVAS